MSRVDYGTVVLSINGKDYTLTPTLEAFKKIQNRWGGIMQAIEACRGLSTEACAYIVAAGAKVGQREAKDLEQEIFEAGVVTVTAPVVEYLSLLLNPTGRDATPKADDSGE